MSDERAPLVIDVEGLPSRLAVDTSFGGPQVVALMASTVGVQGLVWATVGGVGVLLAVLAGVVTALVALGLGLLGARAHVRLEPEGLRRHDGLRYQREVTPWSTLSEVRPSSRWNDQPELWGGARAAVPPVPLAGWSDDDVRELGRRLAAARSAAAGPPVGRPRRLPDAPGPDAAGQVVVDLDGLPGRLVAPMGARRWRTWSVVAVAAGTTLLVWQLLSWLLGDRPAEPWPVVVGALALWQGVQGLVLRRRQRVLLRPTGVVPDGAPDDRERPWSTRTHVVLPSRWEATPRLLHLRGGPVTLWGLDEQQALLLRRRVEEAVARASAVAGSGDGRDGESDEGQVTRSG